jgi:hypothetical protein
MKKYAVVFIAVVVVLGLALAFYGRSTRGPASPVATPQPTGSQAGHGAPGEMSGKVLETMNAGGYTYVLVEAGADKIWAAGPETEVSVGDVVTLPPGMEMQNFESTSLNRTFDSVLFVSAIGKPGASAQPAMPMGHPPTGANKADIENIDLTGIEVPANGNTVAALYAEKTGLAGKQVVVRGRVVKYTPGVMNKNWLHVRDGSGAEGTNDLTVTTDAVVKVGDLVVVKGVLTIGRDFGMGYKYEVLVEDAEVTVE